MENIQKGQNIFNEQINDDDNNVMFKLADLDLDGLLREYGKDSGYGEYEDYEVYKNYSLSRESWIDFIEVKYRADSSKDPVLKYFGIIVLQGYLCSLDEIQNPENLYFELYLEDVLKSTMIKSLKYDYIQVQQQQATKETKEQEQDSEIKEQQNQTDIQQEPDISPDTTNSNYLI